MLPVKIGRGTFSPRYRCDAIIGFVFLSRSFSLTFCLLSAIATSLPAEENPVHHPISEALNTADSVRDKLQPGQIVLITLAVKENAFLSFVNPDGPFDSNHRGTLGIPLDGTGRPAMVKFESEAPCVNQSGTYLGNNRSFGIARFEEGMWKEYQTHLQGANQAKYPRGELTISVPGYENASGSAYKLIKHCPARFRFSNDEATIRPRLSGPEQGIKGLLRESIASTQSWCNVATSEEKIVTVTQKGGNFSQIAKYDLQKDLAPLQYDYSSDTDSIMKWSARDHIAVDGLGWIPRFIEGETKESGYQWKFTIEVESVKTVNDEEAKRFFAQEAGPDWRIVEQTPPPSPAPVSEVRKIEEAKEEKK